MVIPFPICLKCVLCVKKIMVCRFLIFPLTIENDEFVLCQSAFAAFLVPIDVQISESHPKINVEYCNSATLKLCYILLSFMFLEFS